MCSKSQWHRCPNGDCGDRILDFSSSNPSFIGLRFRAVIRSRRILSQTLRATILGWRSIDYRLVHSLLNVNRMWLWDMVVLRSRQTTTRGTNIYLIPWLTRFPWLEIQLSQRLLLSIDRYLFPGPIYSDFSSRE